VAFKLGDGKTIGYPAPPGLGDTVRGMSMVEYRPFARRLLFQRDGGLVYDYEVGSTRDWSPVRGRPVIYLDQNQWSTLSKSVFAPHRLRSSEERDAALALLRLAEQKKVILPLSAAHLSETGAWSNTAGRRELADTILAGSAGWQMRDPLEIRSAEFRAALRASAGLPVEMMPDVFTLAPYAALDPAARGDTASPRLAGMPESWQWAQRTLVANVVLAACMLDQDPTPRGSLEGWLTNIQKFSTWLTSETERTKEQRRRSAYVYTFSDTTHEVANAALAAGVTPAQMGAWTKQTWDKPSLGAPGISLFRAAMVDKLVAGAKWEANDLTDLMYLCTAAAYADHVVGERRTTALLRQATARLKSPVRLHANLVGLLKSLVERRP
jgi:hypothetical protein